jgi:hypothetical protein
MRPRLRQNSQHRLAVELRGKFFFFEFDFVRHGFSLSLHDE